MGSWQGTCLSSSPTSHLPEARTVVQRGVAAGPDTGSTWKAEPACVFLTGFRDKRRGSPVALGHWFSFLQTSWPSPFGPSRLPQRHPWQSLSSPEHFLPSWAMLSVFVSLFSGKSVCRLCPQLVTLPPSCGTLFRGLQLALLFVGLPYSRADRDSGQAGARRICGYCSVVVSKTEHTCPVPRSGKTTQGAEWRH